MSFLASATFANTYFSRLPAELVEYIRCYHHDNSAKIIQFWTKYIYRKKIQELTKIYNFAYTHCNFSPTMPNYSIFYKNKILNRQDIFTTLSRCKCCDRHQINKPKVMELWHNTEFHDTQETTCNCACRHISRFLCREIENSD